MICARCHRRFQDDHLFCPHDGEQLVSAIDIRRVRSKPTELHGTVFGGRYQVRGLLGKGAMAQVLLALDRISGAPVAVKVLEGKQSADKRAVARFIQEAKAASQLTHPNTVEMLDVGLDDRGAPYLVMELLLGESLAEGLAAVHRAGIVHRDVKPDNIFLLGAHKAPHAAKIIDFGFAKMAPGGALTQEGVSVGTVEYMSPEQAVSDVVDARADIYGLGAVMYRMFTGRFPFDGHDAMDVLARHVAEEPPPLVLPAGPPSSDPLSPGPPASDPPTSSPPSPSPPSGGVGAGLAAIVAKAMRKRLEHRYASMEALLDDLGRLDRGEPLAARLAPEAPDVYVPREFFATQAVVFLHRRLGKEPPR